LFDDFVVVFDGAPLRFLVGPRQFVHQPADVVSMVSHGKLRVDEIRDALGRPQLRAVSVGHGPLQEIPDQTHFLLCVQPRRTPGYWFGAQRIRASGCACITPSHYATGVAADYPCDFMQGVLLFQ
jgi:hypothetical protein